MGGKKSISRRGFLGLGAASATAGGVIAGQPAAAEAGPPASRDEALPQVPRARLGKTDAHIPILASGGGFEPAPRFDPRLAECVRFGVDYFDAALAPARDATEAALGRYHTRAGNRDALWITSRSDRSDPAGFEARLNESLSRLRTSYVELFCLDGVRRADELDPGLADVVARLKGQGKLRHFGLCCADEAGPELLSAASARPWIEVVTFRYGRRSGSDAAWNAALDRAARADIGLIAEAPPITEALTPDPAEAHQRALDAIWDDERITAALCVMDTFEQIKANVAAATRRPPRQGRVT